MWGNTTGRSGFQETLRSTGQAQVTYTDGDDLAVVIDTLRAASTEVGLDVRVFPGPDRSLTVVAR